MTVGAMYTIEGGEAGKARLDVLARVCVPGTAALFDQVGVKAGARRVEWAAAVATSVASWPPAWVTLGLSSGSTWTRSCSTSPVPR